MISMGLETLRQSVLSLFGLINYLTKAILGEVITLFGMGLGGVSAYNYNFAV